MPPIMLPSLCISESYILELSLEGVFYVSHELLDVFVVRLYSFPSDSKAQDSPDEADNVWQLFSPITYGILRFRQLWSGLFGPGPENKVEVN